MVVRRMTAATEMGDWPPKRLDKVPDDGDVVAIISYAGEFSRESFPVGRKGVVDHFDGKYVWVYLYGPYQSKNEFHPNPVLCFPQELGHG